MQMDGFEHRIVQLFDERIKLLGQFTFGRVIERSGTFGCAGEPPFFGLGLEAVIAASPVRVDMMGDAVDPRGKAGAPLVRSNAIPNLAKRFLSQVRSVGIIAAEPPKIRKDFLIMSCEQLGGRLGVPILRKPAKFFSALAHICLPD